jgi:hypothetical protein
MGGMKGMLDYFRNARIMYKNLSSEYKTINPKKSLSYDRKQLPLKIFINSLFGGLSAPHVYEWGEMNSGERITCTGRQYLRQMVKYFVKRGYTPLVLDTDGVNFSLPKEGVEDRVYIGKGLNWLVKEGKEYRGYYADTAEYNDLFMKNSMGLDCDGTWDSCINLSRKNYATMESNGKIKLTGNSIKSKKLPLYIEVFLDKGVRLLLEGKGQEFIEWYFEYHQRIYNQQIPLKQIAQRARVKLSIDDYKKRCGMKTKAGSLMSRMSHMELVIKHNLKVSLGDVISYVNNGTKASHGDVQKITKNNYTKKELDLFTSVNGMEPENKTTSTIQLNCYLLDQTEIENNPELIGEYNVARAITTFNKKVEPLLIVFNKELRESLLIANPEERGFFTKTQCELVSGVPNKDVDQDKIEDLLTITDLELKFWDKVGVSPDYIYDLAEPGWEEHIN